MANSPLERLVLPPGHQQISPQDILARLEKFVSQVPGLSGIIIIGREGDLATHTCRQTRGLPDSRIREVLVSGLLRFDHRSDEEAEDPSERLIQIPGMRHLSIKEAEQRATALLNQCPGLTLVMLLCRDGDLGKMRRLSSNNITRDAARELLRKALVSFDKRGLPPPAA